MSKYAKLSTEIAYAIGAETGKAGKEKFRKRYYYPEIGLGLEVYVHATHRVNCVIGQAKKFGRFTNAYQFTVRPDWLERVKQGPGAMPSLFFILDAEPTELSAGQLVHRPGIDRAWKVKLAVRGKRVRELHVRDGYATRCGAKTHAGRTLGEAYNNYMLEQFVEPLV